MTQDVRLKDNRPSSGRGRGRARIIKERMVAKKPGHESESVCASF